MKLHRITLVAATAIALAATSVAFGSGAGSGAVTTIKVTALYTGLTKVDADHNGKSSIGDYALGPLVFLNDAGKRSGRGSWSCLQINAAETQYQCNKQYHFAGGDVFTTAPFSVLSKTTLEAVIGGTGVYAGKTGTVAGTWLASDFSKARLVFTLRS